MQYLGKTMQTYINIFCTRTHTRKFSSYKYKYILREMTPVFWSAVFENTSHMNSLSHLFLLLLKNCLMKFVSIFLYNYQAQTK